MGALLSTANILIKKIKLKQAGKMPETQIINHSSPLLS